MIYEELTAEKSPVSLVEAKRHLKQTSSIDDTYIRSLIDACTVYGEQFTGRDFRAKTWKLLLDSFSTRICLLRDKVSAITSVEHIVSGSPVTVSSDEYYLKNNVFTSEILLEDGASWPTDTDTKEHSIAIEFSTVLHKSLDTIKQAILAHVAYVYTNRGDCSVSDSVCKEFYWQIRIPRI